MPSPSGLNEFHQDWKTVENKCFKNCYLFWLQSRFYDTTIGMNFSRPQWGQMFIEKCGTFIRPQRGRIFCVLHKNRNNNIRPLRGRLNPKHALCYKNAIPSGLNEFNQNWKIVKNKCFKNCYLFWLSSRFYNTTIGMNFSRPQRGQMFTEKMRFIYSTPSGSHILRFALKSK